MFLPEAFCPRALLPTSDFSFPASHRELDEVKDDRDRLQREYEDLVAMYDGLKSAEVQSQKLADES